ncbi:MAG: CAP domain-containing protein [Burkholderiaceae bacterium]
MPATTFTLDRFAPTAMMLFIAVAISACGGGETGDTNGADNSGSSGASAPAESSSNLQENTGSNSAGGSAQASTLPAPIASQAFINKTLERVNIARNSQRLCGTTTMPAQAALTWDLKIEQAALSHTQWMQSNNTFSHQGENDSDPGSRLTNAGYDWNAAAENIAAGQGSIDAVIDAWLDSPGHCRNIMSANVTQIGMALVDGNNSNTYGTYWTMKLARPR